MTEKGIVHRLGEWSLSGIIGNFAYFLAGLVIFAIAGSLNGSFSMLSQFLAENPGDGIITLLTLIAISGLIGVIVGQIVGRVLMRRKGVTAEHTARFEAENVEAENEIRNLREQLERSRRQIEEQQTAIAHSARLEERLQKMSDELRQARGELEDARTQNAILRKELDENRAATEAKAENARIQAQKELEFERTAKEREERRREEAEKATEAAGASLLGQFNPHQLALILQCFVSEQQGDGYISRRPNDAVANSLLSRNVLQYVGLDDDYQRNRYVLSPRWRPKFKTQLEEIAEILEQEGYCQR